MVVRARTARYRARMPSAGGDDVKRAIDVVVSASALILLSPVILVVAILIRWKMGRPILFRQQRPGLGGRPFTMLKFRTMTGTHGPEGRSAPDLVRLTPLRQTLRRYSLDELPELVNVLRGEMSLVGPRPLLMDYLERYSPRQARRNEVRPGITGLAQVSGRNDLGWEERFELDVRYVDTRSVALDLRILARTIWVVVTGHGAGEPDEDFLGTDGGEAA